MSPAILVGLYCALRRIAVFLWLFELKISYFAATNKPTPLEIIILLFSLTFLILFVFRIIIEPTYIMVFNKPIYVHLYMFPKEISPRYKSVLEREFSFYRNLPLAKRKYFRHRVQSFMENYQFVGREGLAVTEEMKVKIAATSVMLTFGMRNYLSDLFETILIYPDIFLSPSSDEYHKGEFNPAAGVVVFSWKHFIEGIEYDNDNLNLGLHEFAHVLHLDSLKRRRIGSSSVIYTDMFDKIMEYIAKPQNREKLMKAEYFRLYAYTNQYEFIAVILEYFFETPMVFRQKLPELYFMVEKMINFKQD